MNTCIRQMFFELVRCALGTQEKLTRKPSEEEWGELFWMCQEQAISGVVFQALDKLSKYGQKPPVALLYEWIGLSEQIRMQNDKVNKNVVEVCENLEKDDFDCVLLKGQGNSMMYPDRFSRTPGDIDVWIRPDADFTDVIEYVKRRNPRANAMYHHIDLGGHNGTEVEVHYRPAFMFKPKHNRRIQAWFDSRRDCIVDTDLGFKVPTVEFNVVFQLAHVFNHLLHEGIGLRQIIDYFYVLRSIDNGELIIDNFDDTLKYLGLWEIAGAVMWMQSEILGLEDKYLITPKDERRGQILQEEIIRGGNFGQFDRDNIQANSRLKKNVQRIKRDIRMMRYFPSECLWEPLFRVYHLAWRIKYN